MGIGMNLFGSKRTVRGLAEPIPRDPNDVVVDEIYGSYPFGAESIGMRSSIRRIVYVVLELKKRGLI
jgi:hypothetical protein